MSLAKLYSVRCDGRNPEFDYNHADGCPVYTADRATSKAARADARKAGWVRIVGKYSWDTRDLSPQCAAREGLK